jgi:hypothetical protein
MTEIPLLVLKEIIIFLPQVSNPKTIEWHKIQWKTCFVSNDKNSSTFYFTKPKEQIINK